MGGNNILFFADTIIDIDFGIVSYIRKEFKNSKFIASNIDLMNDDYIKSYLIELCKNNIMELLLSKEYKYNADNIYKEILDNHYDEIVNLSSSTGMMRYIELLKLSQSNSNIASFVICKTNTEKDKILSIDKYIEVCEEEIDKVNLDSFNRIIVRNIRDLDLIGKDRIKGKHILVLAYRYNYDADNRNMLLKEYTDIADINIFESAIPYNDYKTLKG